MQVIRLRKVVQNRNISSLEVVLTEFINDFANSRQAGGHNETHFEDMSIYFIVSQYFSSPKTKLVNPYIFVCIFVCKSKFIWGPSIEYP